jgi:hypothetical protein
MGKYYINFLILTYSGPGCKGMCRKGMMIFARLTNPQRSKAKLIVRRVPAYLVVLKKKN